jgi:hypothetical protein
LKLITKEQWKVVKGKKKRLFKLMKRREKDKIDDIDIMSYDLDDNANDYDDDTSEENINEVDDDNDVSDDNSPYVYYSSSGKSPPSSVTYFSKLHLIDLAGSGFFIVTIIL